MILDMVNSPEDLKCLDIKELKLLANDIREYIINIVSKRGGHLAPSLGTVELTIALHYIFNSPKDKIIFDVGHQAYTHKILSGRKDEFSTLRQLDGLSGFLKRAESKHDIFEAGHSSTSISAALGLVKANQNLNKSNYVLPIIGDGALTGGMESCSTTSPQRCRPTRRSE